jgi:hypothetical protein
LGECAIAAHESVHNAPYLIQLGQSIHRFLSLLQRGIRGLGPLQVFLRKSDFSRICFFQLQVDFGQLLFSVL